MQPHRRTSLKILQRLERGSKTRQRYLHAFKRKKRVTHRLFGGKRTNGQAQKTFADLFFQSQQSPFFRSGRTDTAHVANNPFPLLLSRFRFVVIPYFRARADFRVFLNSPVIFGLFLKMQGAGMKRRRWALGNIPRISWWQAPPTYP